MTMRLIIKSLTASLQVHVVEGKWFRLVLHSEKNPNEALFTHTDTEILPEIQPIKIKHCVNGWQAEWVWNPFSLNFSLY